MGASALGKIKCLRLALLVSSYGIVTALVLEKWAPQQAFMYIMGGAFAGLMLSWIVSLAAHVSFRWKFREQLAKLPMRSPLGVWGSILGLVLVSIAVLQTLFSTRVNAIGGGVFFALLTFAYFFLKQRRQTP